MNWQWFVMLGAIFVRQAFGLPLLVIPCYIYLSNGNIRQTNGCLVILPDKRCHYATNFHILMLCVGGSTDISLRKGNMGYKKEFG